MINLFHCVVSISRRFFFVSPFLILRLSLPLNRSIVHCHDCRSLIREMHHKTFRLIPFCVSGRCTFLIGSFAAPARTTEREREMLRLSTTKRRHSICHFQSILMLFPVVVRSSLIRFRLAVVASTGESPTCVRRELCICRANNNVNF